MHKKAEDERCKGTKNCVVAEGLMSDDYKTCLIDGETIYREKMLFENKRLVQTFGITTLARGQ